MKTKFQNQVDHCKGILRKCGSLHNIDIKLNKASQPYAREVMRMALHSLGANVTVERLDDENFFFSIGKMAKNRKVGGFEVLEIFDHATEYCNGLRENHKLAESVIHRIGDGNPIPLMKSRIKNRMGWECDFIAFGKRYASFEDSTEDAMAMARLIGMI